MLYTERPPHPALAGQIRCLWAFESTPDDMDVDVQRIVPDGCPEMVLHLGDECHEIEMGGELTRQSRLVFAGQLSRPLLLQPGRRAAMIGIRWQPAGARALLGLSMHETTDLRLDLTQVWAHEGVSLIDAVSSVKGIEARLQLVEKFLLKRLALTPDNSDPRVAHGVALLQSSAGQISVDALADRCGLSSRQLERRFLGEVGIPPRLLAGIFRFRRVFDLLEKQEDPRWVSAAIGAGYFDQAHMIRDFKRFAGQQPRLFYDSLHGLSAAMVGGKTTTP